MHAAAEAFIKAGFAGKNLGHGAVDEEGAGEVFDAAAGEVGFDDLESGTVVEFFHDLHQGVVIQLADGAHALG